MLVKRYLCLSSSGLNVFRILINNSRTNRINNVLFTNSVSSIGAIKIQIQFSLANVFQHKQSSTVNRTMTNADVIKLGNPETNAKILKITGIKLLNENLLTCAYSLLSPQLVTSTRFPLLLLFVFGEPDPLILSEYCI